MTLPVTVTVADTDAVPQEGLPVCAFSGGGYTGYHGVTDAAGEVVLTLPQGDYRFRSDRNGTQFWSGTTDHCTIPGCTEAVVTVTIPLTVTAQSETGSPYPDLPVYAFDGESYTGYHGTGDENGQVVFTLPEGDYRFRADYDGVQFWSGLANHCTIPGCLEALVEIPGGVGGPVSVTIDYSYDPLQRLVAADYSTGEFFHYSYDAAGNRLTQDTLAGTNLYDYDIANRLIEVDGVPYTWDDKGNLHDDGLREYAYDHANRLISVEMGDDNFEFEYSGLGDRLRQTVSGAPIEYTLDLAAGLTQVLSDGDNAYLYGVARIGEQQPNGWQYHLGDALGSSRQLTDSAGDISLANSYAPYGDTHSRIGSGFSVHQFTGEMRDATGLTFLRARYLDTVSGRFISFDPSRFERNLYLYARSNPIAYRDPTGTVTWGINRGQTIGNRIHNEIEEYYHSLYGGFQVHLEYGRQGGRPSVLQGRSIDVLYFPHYSLYPSDSLGFEFGVMTIGEAYEIKQITDIRVGSRQVAGYVRLLGQASAELHGKVVDLGGIYTGFPYDWRRVTWKTGITFPSTMSTIRLFSSEADRVFFWRQLPGVIVYVNPYDERHRRRLVTDPEFAAIRYEVVAHAEEEFGEYAETLRAEAGICYAGLDERFWNPDYREPWTLARILDRFFEAIAKVKIKCYEIGTCEPQS